MNKFKVTYHEPEIEADQIRRHQNFDQLLGQFITTRKRRAPSRYYKMLLGGLLIIASVLVSYWVLDESNSPKTLDRGNPKSQTEPAGPQLKPAGSLPEHPEEIAVSTTKEEKEQQLPKAKPSEPDRPEEVTVKEAQTDKESPENVSRATGTSPERMVSSSGDQKEEMVHSFMEATPKEGMKALYLYFNKHLVYPKEEMELQTEGTVILSFFINKEGRAESIEVVQPVSDGIDQEAIRLVEEMPEWKPALVKGKAVSSRVTLPITFKITNSNVE